MTPDVFADYVSQGYTHIPVARTILADMETPLSAYRKLAQGPKSFLFESVQGGEKWGRYSIIGLPARKWLTVEGLEVKRFTDGEVVLTETVTDPLEFIEQSHATFRVAPVDGLPVFHGGLVGYFGYDAVRYVEPRLAASWPVDRLGTPDVLLLVAEEVLIFDNLAGTLTIVINADVEDPNPLQSALGRLDSIEAQLPESGSRLPTIALGNLDTTEIEATLKHLTGAAEYQGWVKKIRDYILDGDVMQVVPSQRMEVPYSGEPLTLYRALRNLNPSPYMYYLDMGEFQIVGSSPEILVRLQGREVTVRPIAGTRRRGVDDAEDEALAQDLLADPKERAEHLMLIDLGRNDVGKISVSGSVELTENMTIERYSHVMHIVSNVQGVTRDDVSAMDALRAALPAGTLSGAPKVRAMEIIDELETVKRGVYGGAVGYLSWAGDMDTAIAIRTAVVKDGKVIVQAGAGIVADSVPEQEWEETMNKSRAILRAVAMSCG
ncbi:anthranilate synthase component I [Luminiphilus syltensis NOR5-1B]|uniref:Anthranilate synthase component 1 n=1 Tax=Luminiphilus syltensis NOR5-1B TaxID=565045 RepID=B8KVZ1_9GAMM|nr:anthranilate synthase component I [Luminiphilus syltensis]EED36514.1 anthranilate synthase component I [Luminiphilus syltensis NOR5-1B]